MQILRQKERSQTITTRQDSVTLLVLGNLGLKSSLRKETYFLRLNSLLLVRNVELPLSQSTLRVGFALPSALEASQQHQEEKRSAKKYQMPSRNDQLSLV